MPWSLDKNSQTVFGPVPIGSLSLLTSNIHVPGVPVCVPGGYNFFLLNEKIYYITDEHPDNRSIVVVDKLLKLARGLIAWGEFERTKNETKIKRARDRALKV
jgi:hypothetical protein